MKKHLSWLLVCVVIGVSVLVLAHMGSMAVTVLSETLPLNREHCLVVDAGHGGVDGGAISCTGVPESTFNLEIALKLNDLLRLLGYDTRMIRTSDISVYTKGESIAQKKISDLKERVRITNEVENALLISIHQNTFPDSQYNGAQVFYAATEESQELAQIMQAAFSENLNPGSRRQCKKSSGVYLMEHVTKPAILIECGFLSNPTEEANLRNRDYQKKICCVIASTVDTFLSNT